MQPPCLEGDDRVKFGPKARPGRLVGYGSSSKVYKVALFPDMLQIVQSHNVTFDEESVLPGGIYYQNRRATSEVTLEVEEIRATGILSDPWWIQGLSGYPELLVDCRTGLALA